MGRGEQGSLFEWLRRWTRNPLGFARAGANPAAVVLLTSVPDPTSPYMTFNGRRSGSRRLYDFADGDSLGERHERHES